MSVQEYTDQLISTEPELYYHVVCYHDPSTHSDKNPQNPKNQDENEHDDSMDAGKGNGDNTDDHYHNNSQNANKVVTYEAWEPVHFETSKPE